MKATTKKIGDHLYSGENNFGEMANQTWFSSGLLSWWTNLFLSEYGMLVQASSGLIVNGISAISFMLDRLPCLKAEPVNEGRFTAKKATQVLQKTLNKGDFDTLKQHDIPQTIQLGRKVTRHDGEISTTPSNQPLVIRAR